MIVELLLLYSLPLGPPMSSPQMAPFGAAGLSHFEEGHARTPHSAIYRGGYARNAADGRFTVHFYVHSDTRGGRPVLTPLALRTTHTHHGSEATVWQADAANCPALFGVFQSFERFVAPRFTTGVFDSLPEGSNELLGPPQALAGPALSVWGYAIGPDASRMSLTITGGEGLIRTWTDFATTELSNCWRSEEN